MIELYHSRRGHFLRCAYFLRDERESVGDLSKWVYNRLPTGHFYAKIASGKTNDSNTINNAIMFDRDYMTITTNDDVGELSRGCIVSVNKVNWIVEDLQKSIHIKETEFSKQEHCTTIINLRK